MDVRFTATETVEIGVPAREIPIEHYLRQPQRLVQAIADPTRMETLADHQFRLKMRPISFMNLYHFQPTVILKVWTGTSGTVYLQSESCEIRGIDYINDRFFLQVKGKLVPESRGERTLLRGKADLEVRVALPPPLLLTPAPLLEVTGNGLLRSVLLRIKQRLVSQIVRDYLHWTQNQVEVSNRDRAIADGLTALPASNL